MPEPIDPTRKKEIDESLQKGLADLTNRQAERDRLVAQIESMRSSFNELEVQLHIEKGASPSPFRMCEISVKQLSESLPPDAKVPINVAWLLANKLLPVRSAWIHLMEEYQQLANQLDELNKAINPRSWELDFLQRMHAKSQAEKMLRAMKGEDIAL